MSKWFQCVVSCLGVCWAFGCGDMDDGDDSGFSEMERQMLQEVNSVRASGATCGGEQMPPTEPLRLVGALNRAAKGHSVDMAKRNYFDHTAQDGASPSERAKRAGYQGRSLGENIAAGRPTVSEVMAQWMESPGHCKNILGKGYRDFGMGYAQEAGSTYRHYWTQLFGS